MGTAYTSPRSKPQLRLRGNSEPDGSVVCPVARGKGAAATTPLPRPGELQRALGPCTWRRAMPLPSFDVYLSFDDFETKPGNSTELLVSSWIYLLKL